MADTETRQTTGKTVDNPQYGVPHSDLSEMPEVLPPHPTLPPTLAVLCNCTDANPVQKSLWHCTHRAANCQKCKLQYVESGRPRMFCIVTDGSCGEGMQP